MVEPATSETELSLTTAGVTDVGLKRKHNEDVIVVRDDLALYAVCDGAGGHDAGDVAAKTAAHRIAQYIEETSPASVGAPVFDRFGLAVGARRLATAFHRANKDVVALARAMGSKKGMGAVAVGTLFSRQTSLVHLAHAGDSRCYRLRAGNLEQLTRDHSVLNDVIEQRPDLDDQMLSQLPRNAVTRALGIEEGLRVTTTSFEVVDGDRYLLCSDGLSGPVATPKLAEILATQAAPSETAAALINAAKAGGAPDNVSAIVIDCHGPRRSALPITAQGPAGNDDRDAGPELLILGVEDVGLEGLETVDDEELARMLSGLLK